MTATDAPDRPGPLHYLAVFVTAAGLTACITVLSRSMRAVMDVGGFCAEGGPYEIATPCPKGIPGLTIGSIWIGLLFAGLYVWAASRIGTAGLVGLAWPALFLALGWNFLEYGFDPPGDAGISPAWLVCGVVFVLMGGGPLFGLLSLLRRRRRTGDADDIGDRGNLLSGGPAVEGGRYSLSGGRRGADRDLLATGPAGGTRSPRTVLIDARPERSGEGEGEGEESPFGQPEHLVALLERLAALHRAGEIDDEEYRAAKQALLAMEDL